jgi:hypothetical protein
MPDGTPNQNLVPESADEMEKGEQSQTGCRMSGRTIGRARPVHAAVKTKQLKEKQSTTNSVQKRLWRIF